MVRLAFRIGLHQIQRQNDFYCANKTTKEHFIRNAIEINKFNEALSLILDKKIDDHIHLQNTSFSHRKLFTVCW